MTGKDHRFDADRRNRLQREAVVAFGAAGIFVAIFPWASETWLRVWMVVLSVAAAGIAIWRLRGLRLRRTSRASSEGEVYRAELARLDAEIRLQRSLPWWYLAPILIGSNLLVWTSARSTVETMAVFVPISIVVVTGIALATRRSLRHSLVPRRAEVSRRLSELGPRH